MKRGTNDEAGFDLLGLMLKLPYIPLMIFYSRSRIDEDTARQRGAFGIATKASDLVLLVKDALRSKRPLPQDWLSHMSAVKRLRELRAKDR
jgi:hypothetical protein